MALSAPVALSFRKHPSLFIYIFYLFYYVFSKFKAAQDAIEVGVIWPPFTRRFRLGFTLLRQHNDGYHLGIDGSRPACLCEALLCSQMLAPPQSLHWPLMRLCSQMLVPAVLGPAPDAVMLVDAGSPTAVLAHAPDAVMLVDAGAPAVLALAPDAVMLADAGAPAVLAGAPAAVMSQMPAPPQSLQVFLWRRGTPAIIFGCRLSRPHKPLCNLGAVLASELHGIRMLLPGLWGAVTDNVIMVVELTHERRTRYQLKWPEKLVRQEACTAKDTIVSFAASLTSVFGAVSHLMQDVSLHHGFVGSNVDSRVHARYIMMLTAITNIVSSMLWFVYQGLVLQKFFTCTANEVLYKIDTIVSNGQPTMSIRFGDPQQDRAIADAGVADWRYVWQRTCGSRCRTRGCECATLARRKTRRRSGSCAR